LYGVLVRLFLGHSCFFLSFGKKRIWCLPFSHSSSRILIPGLVTGISFSSFFLGSQNGFFKKKTGYIYGTGAVILPVNRKDRFEMDVVFFFFGTTGELRLSLLLIKEKSALELSLFF